VYIVKTRRIDWPLLAETLLLAGISQYSVLGTYQGEVIIALPWTTLVQLNKIAKIQRARLYHYRLAA